MPSTLSSTAPGFDDLMSPANIQDPFPLYGWLRRESPVHWNQRLGGWMVARFEDVRGAFANHRLFSSQSGEPLLRIGEALGAADRHNFDLGYRFFFRQMQTFDPPEHTVQRSLASKAFTPRVMESIRASVQTRVDVLIDRLHDLKMCDFVAQFAYPLPSLVIFDLLGVPEEHYAVLRSSAASFARFAHVIHQREVAVLEEIAAKLVRAEALLRGLIAGRRAHPRDDLISSLVHVGEGPAKLSDDDIVVLCNFLLFAGHETTANLLAGSLLQLLGDRTLWMQLTEHPQLLGNAAEELLRFISPVLTVARVLKDDHECHGTVMKKGDRVSLLIGAANHDPTEFADADRLKLDRIKPHSVAFGHGIHHCIGAALARMETQLALASLIDRCPGIELASGPIEYQPIFFLRALKSLPIVVDR